MAENLDRGRNKFALGLILGAAVVIIGVLAYVYYERVVDRPGIKIDVPGFQGEITRDKGVDIEVGRDKP
jgi:hypothetical protein